VTDDQMAELLRKLREANKRSEERPK